VEDDPVAGADDPSVVDEARVGEAGGLVLPRRRRRRPAADLAGVFSALAVLGIASAVGLLRLYRWAWYAAMLFTGVGLAVQLLLHATGTANDLYLVTFVVEAFYLNQREVRRLFQTGAAAPAPPILEPTGSGER
jgi:hypothetical protein